MVELESEKFHALTGCSMSIAETLNERQSLLVDWDGLNPLIQGI